MLNQIRNCDYQAHVQLHSCLSDRCRKTSFLLMLLGDANLKQEHLLCLKKNYKKKLPDHLKTVDNLTWDTTAWVV